MQSYPRQFSLRTSLLVLSLSAILIGWCGNPIYDRVSSWLVARESAAREQAAREQKMDELVAEIKANFTVGTRGGIPVRTIPDNWPDIE